MTSEFLPNVFHPFYFARRALYQSINELAKELGGDLLDVGCGAKPYESLFNCKSYTGIDVEQEGHSHENEEIDVYYDGKTIPFDASKFDGVITSQVFEHVFTPDLFLSEINRVLKTGGKLLLTVPFVWDEHEQPFDFARYSSFGLTSVLKEHGFEVIKHKKTLTDIRVIYQLLNCYIYKKTFKGRWFSRISKIIFILPTNILGIILGKILPDNRDLYLDNVVLAVKK